MSLAAIILTKNEERDLPGCLESLKDVAGEVFVVDSGSTDNTVDIAERMGAAVLQHPFENYAKQMNWAIENAPSKADWLLRIDADERLDREMGRWLKEFLETAHEHAPAGDGDAAQVNVPVNGVLVARRTEFLGQRLRHGGTFPVWLLRVWRRGFASCEDRWMDEHMVLKGGRAVKARGELLHVIPKSLADWSRKHVWYAERECLDAMADGRRGVASGSRAGQDACPDGQAGVKRAAKTKVYYRMPPMVRVMAFWFYRYVVQLGFLDGKAGFLYHFLQCAWYRMLVDAMLMEGRGQQHGR